MDRPKLERRQSVGQYGEIVDELTPESEARWAEYLRQQRMAKLAIRSTNERTTETSDAEGSASQR